MILLAAMGCIVLYVVYKEDNFGPLFDILFILLFLLSVAIVEISSLSL